MNIRPATTKDLDQVYALGQGVSEFSVNSETVTFWPKHILESVISSKDVLIFVADDGDIVGFIIAMYNERLKKAVIENVYVNDTSRGKNIGSMLLEKLVEDVLARGCEYIATLVPLGANAAIGFYKSHGFSKGEQFLWLDKTLDSSFRRDKSK